VSSPGSDARRVHIDTDPGLDDLLALALALASPEIEVVGITTVAGNGSLEAVTENAQRFLALVREDIPLGRGASGPLELERVHAEHVHGADARGAVQIPAIDRRPLPGAREVLKHSLGEQRADVLLALGPLTNVARLLLEDPDLLAGVEVVWMGGTLGPGNATAAAEFNCWADPAAADRVLGASCPVRVIGLEVTREVSLRPAEVPSGLFGSGERGRFLRSILNALMRTEKPLVGEPCATLHDPSAVLAACGGDLFRYEPRALRARVVEGSDRGRLEPASSGRPAVRYASEVHHTEVKRLFLERLAAWTGGQA